MLSKNGCEIVFSRHAFIRAMQRGIGPDIIETTIKTEKIKRFGKNNLKFEKKFRNFTIICVDEKIGETIKIVTIVKKERL
jgi:hypothetical protein